MPQVAKVWDCFNANSSSNHCLVILKAGHTVKDVNFTPFEYNSEDFVLASPEAKRDYMATLLKCSITPQQIHDILGVDLPDNADIDHNSRDVICTDRYGNPHILFITDLCDYIINTPTVVIHGGYDDAPSGSPFERQFPYYTGFVLKDGDYYINVNRNTGEKVVFTFRNDLDVSTFKPSFPYLADLKITNKCSKGCEYCYQASTSKGLDAPMTVVKDALDRLAQAGVFELAIGGGEPTEHGRFADIIEYARLKGFIVNYTTKNSKISDKLVKAINKYVSCAALSFDGENLEDLLRLSLKLNVLKHIQIIPALLDKHAIDLVLDFCRKERYTLTLLGYKYTGRGKNFSVDLSKEWENVEYIINSHNNVKLIGDTTLVSRYPELSKNTPKSHFHKHEGEFSLYIDACLKQYGVSSYHTETFTPYDDTTDFNAAFLAFDITI